MDELKDKLAELKGRRDSIDHQIKGLQREAKQLDKQIDTLEEDLFWQENPGERLQVGETLCKSEEFYQIMESRGYSRRQTDEWYPTPSVSYIGLDGVGIEATSIRGAGGSIWLPVDVARTMKQPAA